MDKKSLPPSQTADKFIIRLPEGMRDRITEEAKSNGRTMNAEVVARLQDSFEALGSADAVAAQALADSRAQTITAMAFLQASLCETVTALYAALPDKARRERSFKEADRLASSLLVAAKPGDYLLSKSDMLHANSALARFLEEIDADIEAHRKKEARTGKTSSAKR